MRKRCGLRRRRVVLMVMLVRLVLRIRMVMRVLLTIKRSRGILLTFVGMVQKRRDGTETSRGRRIDRGHDRR